LVFTKPTSRSFVPVVVMLGLMTLMLEVPLSLPTRDIALIGEEPFEPFTTTIDITRGCAIDRFMVTV
jgi:hypothetical protein